MVKKTNTAKSEKNEVKAVKRSQTVANAEAMAVERQTLSDLKSSVLVVSLFINAFVFTAWLTIQVTDRYNADIIAFLLR